MPRDFADLAASFAAMPAAIEDAQHKGVRAAALAVTGAIRGEIGSATGGSMRLSGVGRKGARVGARFQMEGGLGEPAALIKATGPLQLIERDTAAHSIIPRGWRVSRKWGRLAAKGAVDPSRPVYLGKGKVLKIGDGFRMFADHPGTKGKHPFEHGWRKRRDEVPAIVQEKIRQAFAKEFS